MSLGLGNSKVLVAAAGVVTILLSSFLGSCTPASMPKTENAQLKANSLSMQAKGLGNGSASGQRFDRSLQASQSLGRIKTALINKPEQIAAITEADARILLGAPQQVRGLHPGQVYQYRSKLCVLDLFIDPAHNSRNARQIKHFEIRPRGKVQLNTRSGVALSAQPVNYSDCMASLLYSGQEQNLKSRLRSARLIRLADTP